MIFPPGSDWIEPLETLRVIGLNVPILDKGDLLWRQLDVRPTPRANLGDRFCGSLVGGAIGDAMGRPNEGARPRDARGCCIREYQPWRGYRSGPKGTITDDTQMTMWLAEAILAAEAKDQQEQHQGSEQLADRLIDPDDIILRFTCEHIRGIGQATREFVHNYKDLGKPWYEAGVRSAGNGTAMRAAPVGLVHLGDPKIRYRTPLAEDF
jgi:ADP-ribosylglycohydrolase